jgi:hypothetical protein
MTELFETIAQWAGFFAIVEECCKFGFGGAEFFGSGFGSRRWLLVQDWWEVVASWRDQGAES